MEHVQPFERPFPWRAAALAAALVALAALGATALLHQRKQTRAEPGSARVPKSQAAIPRRPRSRTSVLVLNGNGVNGAAGDLATRLLARGYAHSIPADAQNLRYARSLVLFRPGWQSEAERLARDAGIRSVAPLDGTLSPTYGRYPLVLILGAN